MFKILLILFIVVPILEIYLLIQIGSVIGAWPTIGLVLLTAILGASMLRIQGLSTLAQIRESLDRRELPAVQLVEGLLLAVCGA
ncbi:MAG: FxsA family protein, partial [Gammaproteobacteria bacterium]|nr:FxsA family protein [Gammaproteobacteria bacterium]NIN61686.1 FxsA family protein [Gammaproteobacteria bacterium]NIO63483.1 FxsA family protein [Gammaproteobacteria bacterium]NIQ19412.1 FxsA family protein [Gammaproteobacteria bacterium]NIT05515.1 FxsA family protein [Gammaproteobacteria bacterium]